MSEISPFALPVLLEHLRLLKRNERPRPGDFVMNGCQAFELWEGPRGFRADAYVKQIYRRLGRLPAKARNKS